MIGFLSFLAGVGSFFLKVWSWFSTRSAQKQGADAQSGRDNHVAASTEAGIAQAEENAPKSDAEVDQRLKDHSL